MANRHEIEKKEELVCPNCKKLFTDYKSNNRTYCSRKCSNVHTLFRNGHNSWLKGMVVDRIKYPKMGHFEKHSKTTKELIRRKTIEQHIRGFPQTNTSIERIMEKALKSSKISFVHPFNFNNKFACDFAIPSSKIIIECDGDYWHNREDSKNRDKRKNAYIRACGWNMMRFWEHEINEDIDKCIQTIIMAI